MPLPVRRIAVITGDHALPDPTKRGAAYHEEDEATHRTMMDAFRSLDGYDFAFWSDHDRLLRLLRETPPDLVVNFCDTGFRNVPTRELNLPAYMELLGIPYTGAPPAAMVLCFDKAIVRLVARSVGIAVPEEAFVPADAPIDGVPDLYPALIKPNRADGSVGITKDAVVRSRADALEYLRWLRTVLPGHDALIQEYLPGPEYGVGLIGNPGAEFRMLPPLEVNFSALPAGLAPILSFESKAMPDSPYWTDITFERARIPPEMETRLEGWSKTLFKRLGLQDYGRFDYRVGADGAPKLMEVNPNPAWANDGKLAFMAGFAGLKYRDMLRMILEAAIARISAPAPGPRA